MSKIILPNSSDAQELKVVLSCPNAGLLTYDWNKIMAWVNKSSSKRQVLKKLRDLARDYGEINRGYSYKLPTKYVCKLQKRMSEIERIMRYIIKNDRGLNPEFKEMLKDIRGHFSGKQATNVKRSF